MIEAHLEFSDATEDGMVKDPGAVDSRPVEPFALELGVTVGGVALEEVISPSTVHL